MYSLHPYQVKLYNKGWPIHTFDFPVEIIPQIWLSGIKFQPDLPQWCKDNGFTHIVNCSGVKARNKYYLTHPQDHNIEYCELNMVDVKEQSLYPYLPDMLNFVNQAYDKQGKILIHCVWGQSRSTSCIIYFLIRRYNLTCEQALEIIRKVRPGARPNKGFYQQLKLLQ